VFVEQNEGQAVDVSLELVCKGRELADRLGVGLSAVVCGEHLSRLAEKLVAGLRPIISAQGKSW